jgi:hypothetical protein
MCISYDRLMDISTHLANSVCAQYHAEGLVCPPQLRQGIFTCGAIDNIDHNPTARTAKDSFHGTAISLLQFPTNEHPGIQRNRISFDGKQKALAPLPHSYTIIKPVTVPSDPLVPFRRVSFLMKIH